MKKSILNLLSLILLALASLSATAAKKPVEANPINVAFMLAQRTDTAQMSAIIDYYGYQLQPTQDGYITVTHPNGSIIRYTFQDATESQPYPKVEVKSKQHTAEINSMLEDLRFKKQGSAYIRKSNMYSRSAINCHHAPHGYLIFHQTLLPKD